MLRDRTHGDHMMIGTKPDMQLVSDLQLLGALGALTIYFDLTRFDRGSGECARFEEARRPKPFVESDPYNLV